jgi:cobaltochelatase CobS
MSIGSKVKGEALRFGAAIVDVQDLASMDDYDKAFIPTWDDKYQPDDDLFEGLAMCTQEAMPALLVGPPGCGKTTGVRALASLINQPCRKMSMNGDLRVSDFVGTKVLMVDPATGQTITGWRDSILPDAMRRGHWLVLDEWDACPPEIAFVMQSVLEPERTLVLTDNYGEVLTAHQNFRIFATANTIGKGDDSGIFAGTHVQNEATLDRFCVLPCSYQSSAVEIKIVCDRSGIDRQWAITMVESATQIREGFKKSECSCSFSTRWIVAWATFADRFLSNCRTESEKKRAVAKAYRMTIGGKLGPEDAKYVAGVVQRIMTVNVEVGQ